MNLKKYINDSKKNSGEVLNKTFISNKTFDVFMNDIFKRHKIICVGALAFLVFLLIFWKSVWNFIDGFITVGTLLAVLINTYINSTNEEKSLEKISIYLKVIENNDTYKLNLEIPRKNISRAEIQGILGNFLQDIDRYKIIYMSEIEYLNKIYDIQDNKDNKLVINITKEELDQFDLEKMEKINAIYQNNSQNKF